MTLIYTILPDLTEYGSWWKTRVYRLQMTVVSAADEEVGLSRESGSTWWHCAAAHGLVWIK